MIGAASLSLAQYLIPDATNVRVEEEVTFHIRDDKGQVTGQVTLVVMIEEAVTVSVQRIVCRDLKNVEMFGHNDPFVEIYFGHWDAKTDAIDDAGLPLSLLLSLPLPLPFPFPHSHLTK